MVFFDTSACVLHSAPVGGHACLVQYPAWACVAGALRGLGSDHGDFADLRGVVVRHVVEQERGVFGVGCLHLVPYGVTIMEPCRTDGSGAYGAGPAPVFPPCVGHGTCGRLGGGGGLC